MTQLLTVPEAMARALELALGGWGRVAPNPLVGAVLLKEGRGIAEGAHLEFGGPHAEVVALGRAGSAARGATCVLNLEPCAHHGKTPPCTDALVAAGIARVVAALRDPHAEAAGGSRCLEEAGIVIEFGALAREAAALNAPFLWAQVRPERPFVALKLAASLDGFLADARGRSRWISGPESREFVHWLRAGFDAIGVGNRTVQVDDPRLTVRGPVVPRVAPLRVVFARSGWPGRDREVVRSAHEVPTVVFTGPDTRADAEAELRGTGVRVSGVPGLAGALRALRRDGVQSTLVEGGGRLARALLEEGLVDRLYWIQAPLLLGSGVPAFGARAGEPLGDAAQWVVIERRALGDDTLLVVDRELCLPAS